MHKTLSSQLHQLLYNYRQCHLGFSKPVSILKESVRKVASSQGEVAISMHVVCRGRENLLELRVGEKRRAFKGPSLANVPAGKPRPRENSQLSALGECYVKANSAWTLLSLPPFHPPVCCPSSHLYTFQVSGELSLLNLDFFTATLISCREETNVMGLPKSLLLKSLSYLSPAQCTWNSEVSPPSLSQGILAPKTFSEQGMKSGHLQSVRSAFMFSSCLLCVWLLPIPQLQ